MFVSTRFELTQLLVHFTIIVFISDSLAVAFRLRESSIMEYMTENIEPTTTAGKMYVDLRNYVDVHFEYFIVYAVNVEF